MEDLSTKKIAILGAGIIGLSTANRLIEVFNETSKNSQEKLNITILSKDFGRDTTSDGAGGLFRPDDRFIGGVPKNIATEWAKESFRYFDRLVFSADAPKAGVFQVTGYQLFNDEREDPSYKDVIYQFRHLTQDELNSFGPKYKYGHFATTIGIETNLLMKYLTDILESYGVKFVKTNLDTLENFTNNNHEFDIIFNCLGLGALEFCNDKKMMPIRGQLIRVKAPWIKQFYYTNDDCYIIPNVNTICLGGTRQANNFSLELDKNDSEGIFERCKKICPSLENAEIEWDWVGLRPHREPIRVEEEILFNKNKKKIIIIHNYGHGGNGISLSRGTVVHAINLLINHLNDQN